VLLQVMEEIVKRYPDARIIYINKEDYQFESIKTHAREFGNLLSIQDNCPKYVVSMDETAGGNFKGIEHIGIRDFLLNKG
jgi:predicted AAA+ superfamily ATPase